MLYKIKNNLTPIYLKKPIPDINSLSRRLPSNIPEIYGRTEKFCKSFYPNSIKSWNNLDSNIRNAPSLSLFKKRLINIIRPSIKETFNLSDRQGLKWIFQIRVGLSQLKAHKLKHNFSDITNDTCSCNLSGETTYHFLITCPNFNTIRQDLLTKVKTILLPKNINFDNLDIVTLLLYGHKDLEFSENRKILELTAKFICLSGRFN